MKSFQIVLVTLIFSISAVKAGGDTFLPRNIVNEKSFDDEEQPIIFLPRCRLDEEGNPTKEVTARCDGHCRRTLIRFKSQSPDVEEDACCCVNWDKSKHANIHH